MLPLPGLQRDRGWSYSTPPVHPLATLPVSLSVACTGLGFAYLSAGLTQPLEVIQTLAQTGYSADINRKEREGQQVSTPSIQLIDLLEFLPSCSIKGRAAVSGPGAVAHALRTAYNHHGYKALWKGKHNNQTGTKLRSRLTLSDTLLQDTRPPRGSPLASARSRPSFPSPSSGWPCARSFAYSRLASRAGW